MVCYMYQPKHIAVDAVPGQFCLCPISHMNLWLLRPRSVSLPDTELTLRHTIWCHGLVGTTSNNPYKAYPSPGFHIYQPLL